MANSYQLAVSDGTMAYLDISISYLDRADISVYFNGVLTHAWTWVGVADKRVSFSTIVPAGVTVMIRRITNASELRHEFALGAQFTAPYLDEDLLQILYACQEANEANLNGDFFIDIDLHGFRLKNVGPAVDNTDALTLGQYRADAGGAAAAAATATAAAASAAASASMAGNLGGIVTNTALVPAAGLVSVPSVTNSVPGSTAALNSQAQALLNRLEYVRSQVDTLNLNDARRHVIYATGNATVDTAALNAAYANANDYDELKGYGGFMTNNRVVAKPTVKFDGGNCTFTHTNANSDLFVYDVGTPQGFPGRIAFTRMKIFGPGNTGTSRAIAIDANSPFTVIEDCFIAGFNRGIWLRDSYMAAVSDTYVTNCTHGVMLFRETHSASLRNVFVDGCVITGLSTNYGGGAGTGVCHNTSVIGGGYQNCQYGVWLEQSNEFHSVNTYHEGNTGNDFRVGVGDAGVYARAVYNCVIDGFNSVSPCASGTNIQVEHAVGFQVRAAAWNTGCSTTNSLVTVDGYSDRGVVDIIRHTTTTPTGTAPVNSTAAPDRCVVMYGGRPVYGVGQTDAVSFGTMGTKLGRLYQGFTGSGRNATTLASASQDLQLRAPEISRIQDASGNDLITADALNGRVTVMKPLYLSSQSVGSAVGATGGATALPAAPLGYLSINLNGSAVRLPYYN